MWDQRRRVNWEDRDPEAVGMLDIPGNEINGVHHMVLLWKKDYVERPNQWWRDVPEADVVENIYDWEGQVEPGLMLAANDTGDEVNPKAVLFFAHPGRYWDVTVKDYNDGALYSPEYYISWFKRFSVDSIIGLEVFNDNDRFPHDRVLWDQVLTKTMPERPVFGVANDDYHGADLYRTGWGVTRFFINVEKNKENLRQAMVDGCYFATHTVSGVDQGPQVNKVTVNEENQEITIDGSDYVTVNWVSGTYWDDSAGRYYSQIVGTGETFNYRDFDKNYVRAELIKNADSKTVLQPFGFDAKQQEKETNETVTVISESKRRGGITPRVVG